MSRSEQLSTLQQRREHRGLAETHRIFEKWAFKQGMFDRWYDKGACQQDWANATWNVTSNKQTWCSHSELGNQGLGEKKTGYISQHGSVL